MDNLWFVYICSTTLYSQWCVPIVSTWLTGVSSHRNFPWLFKGCLLFTVYSVFGRAVTLMTGLFCNDSMVCEENFSKCYILEHSLLLHPPALVIHFAFKWSATEFHDFGTFRLQLQCRLYRLHVAVVKPCVMGAALLSCLHQVS